MNSQFTALPGCPGVSDITYEKHWFHLPSAPSFNICSRCYVDHLSRTPFSSHFQMEYDASERGRSCDFDRPRTRVALAQALQNNNFSILADWINYRTRIPNCKIGGIVTPEDNFDWYTKHGVLIDNFAVCGACYEDYVVGRGFASSFATIPVKQPVSEPIFYCDAGGKIGHRAVNNARDADSFVAAVVESNQTMDCPIRDAVDPSSRNWYKMRPNDLQSHWICDRCYYEYMVASVLEPHVYSVGKPNMRPGEALKCWLGDVLPIKIACNWALIKKDFNVFYRAAQSVVRGPKCVMEGMGPEACWMTLNPPCAEFDIVSNIFFLCCISWLLCYSHNVTVADSRHRSVADVLRHLWKHPTSLNDSQCSVGSTLQTERRACATSIP